MKANQSQKWDSGMRLQVTTRYKQSFQFPICFFTGQQNLLTLGPEIKKDKNSMEKKKK